MTVRYDHSFTVYCTGCGCGYTVHRRINKLVHHCKDCRKEDSRRERLAKKAGKIEVHMRGSIKLGPILDVLTAMDQMRRMKR